MNTKPVEYDDLLKMKEVAVILNCSKPHVYNLARAGKIPTMKTGRVLRTSRRALMKWIEQQHVDNAKP